MRQNAVNVLTRCLFEAVGQSVEAPLQMLVINSKERTARQ